MFQLCSGSAREILGLVLGLQVNAGSWPLGWVAPLPVLENARCDLNYIHYAITFLSRYSAICCIASGCVGPGLCFSAYRFAYITRCAQVHEDVYHDQMKLMDDLLFLMRALDDKTNGRVVTCPRTGFSTVIPYSMSFRIR